MIESISQLVGIMKSEGATKFYAKKLAPNDNSKNQVYLGGNFSALNIVPHGDIFFDDKDMAGSKRDRAKAKVKFFWVDESGRHHAPHTQLVLYPKYPEIRMSGFLLGCSGAPSDVMTVRDEGRILVLGATPAGDVLGFSCFADHPIASAIHNADELDETGVFVELPTSGSEKTSKQILIDTLTGIYSKHWIPSQKLSSVGEKMPYRARNGGGYTLEAELGISPNGYSEPDFLGWEIKQYGVADFVKFRPKSPVTLLTPEPSQGIYRDGGIREFMSKFAYADKSGKEDRFNFGGIYSHGKAAHKDTGLRLELSGYDFSKGKITDIDGGLILLSEDGELAAKWPFTGMMEHWNRKHAQAAYIPSLFRNPPPEYSFGPRVLLCEKTDFGLFLRAVANGVVYYDPAIKIEEASSTAPRIKKRNQFRIKHSELTTMYHKSEYVDLNLEN